MSWIRLLAYFAFGGAAWFVLTLLPIDDEWRGLIFAPLCIAAFVGMNRLRI